MWGLSGTRLPAHAEPRPQHHKDDPFSPFSPFSPFHSVLPNPHSFGELNVRNKSGGVLFNRGSSSAWELFQIFAFEPFYPPDHYSKSKRLGFLTVSSKQDEGKVNSLTLCTTTMNMQLLHFVSTFTLFESKCKTLSHLKLSCEDETDPTRKSCKCGIRGFTA